MGNSDNREENRNVEDWGFLGPPQGDWMDFWRIALKPQPKPVPPKHLSWFQRLLWNIFFRRS